jgi:hypothetical protein
VRQDRNEQGFGERKQRPWRERRQDKPRQDKSESANTEQQLDEDSKYFLKIQISPEKKKYAIKILSAAEIAYKLQPK